MGLAAGELKTGEAEADASITSPGEALGSLEDVGAGTSRLSSVDGDRSGTPPRVSGPHAATRTALASRRAANKSRSVDLAPVTGVCEGSVISPNLQLTAWVLPVLDLPVSIGDWEVQDDVTPILSGHV